MYLPRLPYYYKEFNIFLHAFETNEYAGTQHLDSPFSFTRTPTGVGARSLFSRSAEHRSYRVFLPLDL